MTDKQKKIETIIERITFILLALFSIAFFLSPFISLVFNIDFGWLFMIVGVLGLTFLGWELICFFIRIFYKLI